MDGDRSLIRSGCGTSPDNPGQRALPAVVIEKAEQLPKVISCLLVCFSIFQYMTGITRFPDSRMRPALPLAPTNLTERLSRLRVTRIHLPRINALR